MELQEIAQAAKLVAKGTRQRKVAQAMGVHESTISRALQTQTAKDIIDGIRDRIIKQTIPKAADNITYAIQAYQAEDTSAQVREHGFKGSTALLSAIGILPSHTPSVLIQQVIQGDAITITPELAQSIRDGWSAQAIDVDSPVDNTSLCIDSNTRNGD
ncbi:MAG: helix-turn-helix domain-containing protein [Dehalococcoidia bacterium]|nr:helix-turn-helix domain-containing protein [Dehalococcoidia bacterium]